MSEVERLILSLFAGRGEGAPGAALSGEIIASAIGISRTAVWKHISHLRTLGYGIEGAPSSGYAITSGPESLVPFELEAACAAAGVHRYCCEVIHFDSVVSTNDIAKRLAADGAAEGTIVVAEQQSGGRGRRGRAWASPRGGIWFSLILRPQVLPASAPLITLAAAVATVRACRQQHLLLGPEAKDISIKWPNDILLDERKLGGILCEMAAQPDAVDWVVIGIGLNAGVEFSAIPVELSEIAACLPLNAATGKSMGKPAGETTGISGTSAGRPTGEMTGAHVISSGRSRATLVASILRELELLMAPERSGRGLLAPELLESWKDLSSTIGRRVRVPSASGVEADRHGVARGIELDGSLIVEADGGEIIRCSAGDIAHLSGEELTRER